MTEPLRKRRFGISLKAMLILVMACGLWLGWRENRDHKQQKAVEAITEHGGQVLYGWEPRVYMFRKPPPYRHPNAPRWLRKTLGDEYFQEIASVTLGSNSLTVNYGSTPSRTPVDDDLLAHLRHQNHLEILIIVNARPVTDVGLAHLQYLEGLKIFALADADKVTDVGVSYLATNRRLTSVVIEGTKMTYAGFRSLCSIKTLRNLDVVDPDLTDDDMAAIKGLPELRSLSLGSTHITDRGLENLRGLKHL